jgi:hypothetical protein
MDLEFWKTAFNVLLAVGIVLSAVGTFGAYYFSNKLDAQRGAAEEARRSQDDGARYRLNEQIEKLVTGNEDLRSRLTPFEKLAQQRYPNLGGDEALGKLQNDIGAIAKRADELERKVQAANPLLQPIRTATATVEIQVESDQDINTTFIDRGGYFALAAGDTPLLVAQGAQAMARQTGSRRVVWRGVWNMDASDPAIGKPVHSLREAKYAQIQFLTMPTDSKVLGGTVRLTVNSAVQLDFGVPAQQVSAEHIFVKEISDVLKVLAPPRE